MVPPADAWVLNGVAWPSGVSGDPGSSASLEWPHVLAVAVVAHSM